ncbi:MAG: glycoside hydrolase 43 family protein [Firmicutes bacterium]|nr:glycoside hydrolase 43 family protein [Bacillota bacterium]
MKKNNPIIWADIPDVDVIRVGDTYYMVSTTMHLSPGGVIFRSYDLIHWEIATYLYDILEDSDGERLLDGRGIYGAGMWAATIRHHNGKFYVIFVANDTRSQNISFLFTSDKIEGPWEKRKIKGFYHDCSLFFKDDRPFIVSGGGDIRLVEMRPDLSEPLPGGIDKIIIRDRDYVGLRCEGSHMYKLNGKYYIFMIHWLRYGSKRRTEVCYFSDRIDGEYVGNNVLDDDMGYHGAGVAQGGIVDTPDGDFYAMLFQDHGAVGRIPVLVPVKFEDDGWPIFGIDGKVPHFIETKSTRPDYKYAPIVTSDEFNYSGGAPLPLSWQWNHIPDKSLVSFTEREGWLRIRTARTAKNVTLAQNTLGQRTEGPMCEAETLVDGAGLGDGDYAGISAFQSNYGFIGITREGGSLFVVMLGRGEGGESAEYGRAPLEGNTAELKVFCDFDDNRDIAEFYFKRGGEWVKLGADIHMLYTLDHFMGYRLTLSCYSTKKPGGHADFDYFRYRRIDSRYEEEKN